MISGDLLAAYLVGDVDEEERARIESALADDPELRERLERIRRADEALEQLDRPEPTAAFSARLRDEVVTEAVRLRRERTEPTSLEARRERRRRTLAPVLGAAAAAAAIAVIGVSTGWMLRSASDHEEAEVAMESADDAAPEVALYETTNDYDETELRRLAVNVDTQFIIHPTTSRDEAGPLGDRLVGSLLRSDAPRVAQTEELEVPDADDVEADEPVGTLGTDPVATCLTVITAEAAVPLVPVYVELASFGGEDAVIYAFVTEEPASGEYRRVETWALARSDCEVLGFAQYDRTER